MWAVVEVTRSLPPPPQSEEEWLAHYDPDSFGRDHPSVAVDVVLLSLRDGQLRVPVLRRLEHPDYGAWVLPGGFLRRDERVDHAAERVIRDKLGIAQRVSLDRLHFFDSVTRDARMRVLSMAYLGRLSAQYLPTQDGVRLLEAVMDGDKLRDVLGSGVRLGFDHEEILAEGIDAARHAAEVDLLWPLPMVSEGVFTVPDLAAAREALGLTMSTDALRRRVVADPRVSRADTTVSRGTGRRPPEGYRAAVSG